MLLLRNHGLSDRDTVKIAGYNSRLDTIQAVVGNWLIPKAKQIANKRIKNAKYLDRNLSNIKEITIPPRIKNNKKCVSSLHGFCQKKRQVIRLL